MLLRTNEIIAVPHSCRTWVDKLILARAGFPFTAETPNFKVDIVGYAEGQQIICEPMYTACAVCRMSESIKDAWSFNNELQQ